MRLNRCWGAFSLGAKTKSNLKSPHSQQACPFFFWATFSLFLLSPTKHIFPTASLTQAENHLAR